MKITIHNLCKVFKDGTQALSNINLVIENGIFGLLGPNASGKTTLIRILATLEKPTSGKVTFDTMDLKRHRGKIRSLTGYLPQRFSSFRNMTALEFLDYSASLAGILDSKAREKAVNDTLESLNLYGVRNHNANELSTVMKRHLEIAQAVIGDPKVLIVDEPTVGLSPEERIGFHKLLAKRFGRIEIILFSTHILSDISSACTNVAYLNNGEVAYQGSPENLHEYMS